MTTMHPLPKSTHKSTITMCYKKPGEPCMEHPNGHGALAPLVHPAAPVEEQDIRAQLEAAAANQYASRHRGVLPTAPLTPAERPVSEPITREALDERLAKQEATLHRGVLPTAPRTPAQRPIPVEQDAQEPKEERVPTVVVDTPSTPIAAVVPASGFAAFIARTKSKIKSKWTELSAGSDEADSETLNRLAEHEDWNVRAAVASNRSAPVESLVLLANDPDPKVRAAVANNWKTPAESLAVLGKDHTPQIREGVSSNPKTPVETLTSIANRQGGISEGVGLALAGNPSTPPEILSRYLATKKQRSMKFGFDKKINGRLASNPNTPATVLVELAKDRNASVRRELAQHPRTTSKVLTQLAKDSNRKVRAEVAGNPTSSKQVLDKLAKDSSWKVQGAASNTLRYKKKNGIK